MVPRMQIECNENKNNNVNDDSFERENAWSYYIVRAIVLVYGFVMLPTSNWVRACS